MTYKTRFDGRVFNDSRKRSDEHHGSIKPKSGVKLPRVVNGESFETIVLEIPEIKKFIDNPTHKTKRGRYAGFYSINGTTKLKLGDNQDSVNKLVVDSLLSDIKKMKFDDDNVYLYEETPEQITITKEYQYPRELDEEVKLYGFASRRRKVLAVYKKNERPIYYPLEDYHKNPDFH